MSGKDRRILRELAREVAEIAALPIQAERAQMWRDFNALKPHRPMVLAFPEGSWRELLPDSELQCEDKQLRGWEWSLRAKIFEHQFIHDDHPVTDYFNIGWAVKRSDYGLKVETRRTEALGSYRWEPPVKTEKDLEKLHFPTIEIDRDATARDLLMAHEILGDILRVRVRGGLRWSCGLTWDLILLRGMDQIMLDMYDNPVLLHSLMAFLRDATLNEIATYEKENILTLNNGPEDYVGSGGVGCTDELPANDFGGQVRLKDLWMLGESQEFVGVGPELFNEFALQYQLPLLNKFGLVCYGCCEPLDGKLDLVIRHIPRLRRVSVSPWSDRALAARKLANRYIFSWKPNPAMICRPTVDYEHVEKVTRETLQIARGCCVEMIMKDTHTVHGDSSRFTHWTDIASRLAREMA